MQQRKHERDCAKAAASAAEVEQPLPDITTHETVSNDITHILNPILTVDDDDEQHSVVSNGNSNNPEEVVVHDSSERSYTILIIFEKHRKRMYCKLPQVSHTAIEVPAEEEFHAKRRRLLENITRTDNRHALIKQDDTVDNGPQVGEAVASAKRLAPSGVTESAVGRKRPEIPGARLAAVRGFDPGDLEYQRAVVGGDDFRRGAESAVGGPSPGHGGHGSSGAVILRKTMSDPDGFKHIENHNDVTANSNSSIPQCGPGLPTSSAVHAAIGRNFLRSSRPRAATTASSSTSKNVCHYGHNTTSSRIWVRKPAPSFWVGVPSDVVLCYRCY